ncbi:MAG TPA: carbon starvation CstA family protein, partial [Sphingobium sp.]
AALAIGIVIMAPPLKMHAVTQFVGGNGPVWSGGLFPFLFITIACGAVSGFHALIASGTTPKLIASEAHAPIIGYGAMLMEAFVAIMALVGASILDPGVYFTMNSPAALIGTDAASASAAVTAMGFPISPELIVQTAKDVGEHSIISRAGGAPTLAVAMAEIFSHVVGGPAMKAFWYHFAILFEALFILTAVDAGTRAGRFMLQDLMALAVPGFKETKSIVPGLVATALTVAAWGFFLYQGVTDPLGGVNTLWPVFGISNQMLAAIALMLATAVLFRMKQDRYVWVTMAPTAWLLVCTLSAGALKLISADPKVGFLTHAARFSAAADRGEILAPAKSMEQMRQIIFNDRVDAALVAIFLAVVLSLLFFTIRTCLAARRVAAPTAREIPAHLVPAE